MLKRCGGGATQHQSNRIRSRVKLAYRTGEAHVRYPRGPSETVQLYQIAIAAGVPLPDFVRDGGNQIQRTAGEGSEQ